jgi:hypothetical protein
MRVARRAAAAVMLLLMGCVETYRIPPAQLQYLNGYDIHGEQSSAGATFTEFPYRLLSYRGQPVDYNSTKQLYLLGASEKPLAPPGPFQSIFITESTFDAFPLAGPPVQVPLQSIQAVEIVEDSPERTQQLVVLISIVTSLVLAGITIAATGR